MANTFIKGKKSLNNNIERNVYTAATWPFFSSSRPLSESFIEDELVFLEDEVTAFRDFLWQRNMSTIASRSWVFRQPYTTGSRHGASMMKMMTTCVDWETKKVNGLW